MSVYADLEGFTAVRRTQHTWAHLPGLCRSVAAWPNTRGAGARANRHGQTLIPRPPQNLRDQ